MDQGLGLWGWFQAEPCLQKKAALIIDRNCLRPPAQLPVIGDEVLIKLLGEVFHFQSLFAASHSGFHFPDCLPVINKGYHAANIF